MPMTYAMSMFSEVASDTIRINMTTIRVTTVTNRNNTSRINFDSNHNGPWWQSRRTMRPRHKCAVR